jgi:hypothetical protein
MPSENKDIPHINLSLSERLFVVKDFLTIIFTNKIIILILFKIYFTKIIYFNRITISCPVCSSLNGGLYSLKIKSIPEISSGSGGDTIQVEPFIFYL